MYHLPMEQLLQTLENIGICPETIAAIRAAGDKENALILMMDDDRYAKITDVTTPALRGGCFLP